VVDGVSKVTDGPVAGQVLDQGGCGSWRPVLSSGVTVLYVDLRGNDQDSDKLKCRRFMV